MRGLSHPQDNEKRGVTAPLLQARVSDLDWTLTTPYAESLRAHLLEDAPHLAAGPDVRQIKDNNVRAVFAVEGRGDLPFLIVKRYKSPDLLSKIKNRLVGTKAEQEWRGARELLKRAIPSCRAYALGLPRGKTPSSSTVRASYVILEGLHDTVTVVSQLRALAPQPDTTPSADAEPRTKRIELLSSLADLTKRMLQRGIYHRDFHTGNVLLRAKGGGAAPQLFLIDLHSVACPKHFFGFQKRRLLAKLFLDLENFTLEPERRTFLHECFDDHDRPNPGDLDRLFLRITRRTESLRRRRLKSRTRRCVVKSSRFWNERDGDETLYYLRSVAPQTIRKAIDEHRRLLETESPQVLKRSGSGRTFVTRVLVPSEGSESELSVCVKEHRPSSSGATWHGLFTSRGMAEWYASSGFRVRGIPTPEAIALLERNPGWFRKHSYVLTRFEAATEELDAFLNRTFALPTVEFSRARRVTILERVAAAVSQLHRLGVYHNDLKAKNALIDPSSQPEPRVLFLDLTGVRLWRRLHDKRKIKNLAQLDQSLPYAVSRGDRLRFLRMYRRELGLSGSLADHAREVLKAGEKRTNYWRR